jgi:hypothetical protein
MDQAQAGALGPPVTRTFTLRPRRSKYLRSTTWHEDQAQPWNASATSAGVLSATTMTMVIGAVIADTVAGMGIQRVTRKRLGAVADNRISQMWLQASGEVTPGAFLRLLRSVPQLFYPKGNKFSSYVFHYMSSFVRRLLHDDRASRKTREHKTG